MSGKIDAEFANVEVLNEGVWIKGRYVRDADIGALVEVRIPGRYGKTRKKYALDRIRKFSAV
jgi:hypothetical protein